MQTEGTASARSSLDHVWAVGTSGWQGHVLVSVEWRGEGAGGEGRGRDRGSPCR